MDSTQITARVPTELVKRLDKYAAQHHWSRAVAIRLLIEHGLEQEQEHD